MKEIEMNHCTFRWWDETEYCETEFHADGTKVPAGVNNTDMSWETAKAHGYANLWKMVKEHEFVHNYLHNKRGPSPTLWSVAHPFGKNVPIDEMWGLHEIRHGGYCILTFGKNVPIDEMWEEEDVVMKFQGMLNGIDSAKIRYIFGKELEGMLEQVKLLVRSETIDFNLIANLTQTTKETS